MMPPGEALLVLADLVVELCMAVEAGNMDEVRSLRGEAEALVEQIRAELLREQGGIHRSS